MTVRTAALLMNAFAFTGFVLYATRPPIHSRGHVWLGLIRDSKLIDMPPCCSNYPANAYSNKRWW